MSRGLNKECKRQMRLNIIRHRQQLLKHLENINDTVLKPKIQLNSSDLERLNLIDDKQKPVLPIQVKEEFIEISDTSDELISVGSNEEWNGDSLTADKTDADSRRKSKRFDSTNGIRKLCDSKNNDFIYYLSDTNNRKIKRKYSWKRPNLSTPPISESNQSNTRFRKPDDRIAHNAKERQCRNNIANMFRDLRQICNYLDCNRRIPSKHSILLAAKKECNLLKECEKALLKKKRFWNESNALLKQKLLRLSNTLKSRQA